MDRELVSFSNPSGKKMIRKTIALALLIGISNPAVARDNIGKFGVIVGNIGVQYEHSLTDRFSILGQVGYSDIDTEINGVASKYSGTGVYLEGRFYLSSNRDLMEGWHIGPYYNQMNTRNNNDQKADLTSVGLSLGYQFVTESRVTTDIIFGGGSLDLESDRAELEFLGGIGFFPHFGLAVGYSF